MNKLALMTSAALLSLAGAAYAQDSSTQPVGTGTNTGTDVGSRSTTGLAGDTPTATSTAAQGMDTGTTAPADATAAGTASTDSSATAASGTTATDSSATAATTGTTANQSASATPSTGTSGASATVQSQWATYDKDSTGGLSPLEFGTWILAAQGQDMSTQVESTKTSKRANLPAIKVLNATAAEFSKADSDKDRAVSPTELTGYLGG